MATTGRPTAAQRAAAAKAAEAKTEDVVTEVEAAEVQATADHAILEAVEAPVEAPTSDVNIEVVPDPMVISLGTEEEEEPVVRPPFWSEWTDFDAKDHPSSNPNVTY